VQKSEKTLLLLKSEASSLNPKGHQTDVFISFLKGQCHEIFCFWFFYESVSPQPQSVPLGPFRIFSKIRGDIRKSTCTTGVNDTGGKFATGVNDTDGKLPPVSTTPAASLPPVSTTPAANFATSFPCAVDTGGKFATGVNDTGDKFAAGVVDTGGK
jgi:hypothetical protein